MPTGWLNLCRKRLLKAPNRIRMRDFCPHWYLPGLSIAQIGQPDNRTDQSDQIVHGRFVHRASHDEDLTDSSRILVRQTIALHPGDSWFSV